jgi:rSAM/selenodomain-associated transferase 2
LRDAPRRDPREPRTNGPALPTGAPALSVVVPALDEARTLPALLDALRRGLRVPHEVIVADGGSADGTDAVARDAGARVVTGARGRGRQLAAAVAASRAPLLCALHADARPSPAALARLDALAAETAAGRPPAHAYAFRLAIDAPGAAFRVVERTANARSRWLALPYGDQGLVMTRAAYDAAGGYPPWPLMEDVALVRALARVTGVRLLDAAVTVSARRWQRDGVVRRTLANWRLLARYLLGASPERLARDYGPEAPSK